MPNYNRILSIFIPLLFCMQIFAQDTESDKEFLKENKKIITEKKDRIYDLESNKKDRREEPDFIKNGRELNMLLIGGSVGSPASINANLAYYFKQFVVRGSGMYFNPHWNGLQGDIGYSFYKTEMVIMGFSLVGGYYKVNPFDPQPGEGGQTTMKRFDFPGYQNQPVKYEDNIIRSYISETNPDLFLALEYTYRTRQEARFYQNYIGITYDLYLDGFFFQLGLGVGKGDYRNPQLLFQVGYLFNIGKK